MSTGMEGVLMEGEALTLLETPKTEPGPVDAVILRVLGGEQEAFEDLMALTEMKVLAVAWCILGDRDQARDAAQEVFLRIFRSLNKFRIGESFQAWTYRITVNVCYDQIRKRGPVMASLAALEAQGHAHGSTNSADEAMLLDQRRVLFRQALASLTPAERSALVLRDIEGLSTQEAARALGIRPATVRSQISAARAKVQVFCARLLRRTPGDLP